MTSFEVEAILGTIQTYMFAYNYESKNDSYKEGALDALKHVYKLIETYK